MRQQPESFLRVAYRIAEIRRQDRAWHTDGLVGSAMPPGAFVTLEPAPPPPWSEHSLVGVNVKVDGVPTEFVAGRIADDGRLCLFFDEPHALRLQVGSRVDLSRAAPRQ